MSFNINGQNEFVHKLYRYQSSLLNPATVGANREYLKFHGYVYKQWIGTPNSPTTQILSGEFSLYPNLGLGTYIFNDKNGNYKRVGVQQSCSYEIMLHKSKRHVCTLAFGLSLNVEQHSINTDFLNNEQILDPVFNNNDINGVGFNSNTGLLLRYDEHYIGFSALNLLPQTNKLYRTDDEPPLTINFNFLIGTSYKLKDRDVYFEPFFRFHAIDKKNKQIDVNFKHYWYPPSDFAFWWLASYRHSADNNFGKMLGLSITPGVIYKNLSVGIEYQLGLTKAQVDYGSYYQLVISYGIKVKKPHKRIPCSIMRRNKRHRLYKYLAY